ncbi:metal ABC transporter permease [Desmospora profundinema]|uniref:Manganese/zinc/iron transport system permease protein n=1 Tax=Desmospora profundinema TaxID=1571184 RepID=A0ABU1INT6_9BACL|nr:iron chelate uptake ABC transporter family permease subunit [Desmospora profundinema]MDR6226371.1 manganese/zinc/iron transport system permease protein [Desmospora profundinema]
MPSIETILRFLSDPNTLWVLSGTMLLGLSSGVIGAFAFLRKRSLMGDVLAHAALPGICIAFMLTGAKSPIFFLIGAILSGVLASIAINVITRFSRIKEDTALGLILSVFFGFGIVLLTQIQHQGSGNQSGLDKFLFGQSASLVGEDVWVMGSVAVLLLVVTFLFFKEFKLLCFDAGFGRSLGFPMTALDLFLMLLLVVAVVIGLQAAGVVLVVALIVTPAAAARYWTERLDIMLILSAILGGLSGALGTGLSTMGYNLPTGPLIVVAASFIFFISMVFAPQRGLLAKALRLARVRRETAQESILHMLYEARERGAGPVTVRDVATRFTLSSWRLQQAVRNLVKKGWIRIESRGEDRVLTATENGWQAAYNSVLHARLTEVWMMHENEVGGAIRDPDSGALREEIPEDILPTLWKLLILHGREPQWKPSLVQKPEQGGVEG